MYNSWFLEDESEDERAWARAEEFAQAILAIGRRRARWLGAGYPLVLRRDCAARRTEWEECLCYSMLLGWDLGSKYTCVDVAYSSDTPETRLFEKIVQAALAKTLGGTSIRFGWPREPSWPKPIVRRLTELADEFGLDLDEPEKKVRPRDKDLGLDVATRMKFGHEGAGTAVLLTQCATGKNWMAKKEPSLEEWRGLLYWKAHLIRGVAVPRRVSDDRLVDRATRRLEALVFDRIRLFAAGNPDAPLHDWARDEIAEWCEEKLSQFPHLE